MLAFDVLFIKNSKRSMTAYLDVLAAKLSDVEECFRLPLKNAHS